MPQNQSPFDYFRSEDVPMLEESKIETLMALSAISGRAAASVNDLVSFLRRDPHGNNNNDVTSELVDLYQGGHLCRSYSECYYSLTPLGLRIVETERMKRASTEETA